MNNHDRINEVYYGELNNTVARARERIHWVCKQVTGKYIYDIGCSQGIVSLLLGREGHKVIGIDVEQARVEYAVNELKKEQYDVQQNINFIHGNAITHTFDDDVTFDTVIMGEVIEHLNNPSNLYDRVWNLLNNNGKVIITTPFGIQDHYDHKTTYYLSNFLRETNPYFELNDFQIIENWICFVGKKRSEIVYDSQNNFKLELLQKTEDTFNSKERNLLNKNMQIGKKVESLNNDLIAEKEKSKNKQVEFKETIKHLKEMYASVENASKEKDKMIEHYKWLVNRLENDNNEDLKQATNILLKQNEEIDTLNRKMDQTVKNILEESKEVEDIKENINNVNSNFKELNQFFKNEKKNKDSSNDKSPSVIGEYNNYYRQYEKAIKQRDKNIDYLLNRLTVLEQSTKYRVGNNLVDYAKNPLNFKQLYKLCRVIGASAYWKIKGKKKQFKMLEAPYYISDAPSLKSVPNSGQITVEAAEPKNEEKDIKEEKLDPLFLYGRYNPPSKVEDLKIAVIMDDFSFQCFKHDANLITFKPDNWKEVLSYEKPNMLIVESAWNGNSGAWQYKIAKYPSYQGEDLHNLIEWCKSHNIPTIFWNKEDPIHYERFIDSAKKFDYVFTTDSNRIESYKKDVGHNNVDSLQFAAQPILHNPIQLFSENHKKNVCFAGSYYANRHEERRKDMDDILDAAREMGLEIFDRNYFLKGKNGKVNQFPKRFHNHIVGHKTYEQLVKEYKRYKVFLNVNSVKDSPTMYSRRVFELLACGTPVLSSFSEGVYNQFNDIVLISNGKEDAKEKLNLLLSDDNERLTRSLKGQREVYNHHTYKHRLYQIANKVGFEYMHRVDDKVTVFALISNNKQIKEINESFHKQNYSNLSLILFVQNNTYVDDVDNVKTVNFETYSDVHSVLKTEDSQYFIQLHSSHEYGENFITDYVHSYIYSNADIVTKNTYYSIDEGGSLRLNNDNEELNYSPSINLHAFMFNRKLLINDFNNDLLVDVDNDDEVEQEHTDLFKVGYRVFSNNRYNFIKGIKSVKDYRETGALIKSVEV